MKIKKIFLFLLALLVPMGLASAHDIVNDTDFNLGNGVYITVLATQNFTTITVYNASDSPSSTLEFGINSTYIRLNSSANFTLSGITYISDTWNFTANASVGTMKVSAKMQQGSLPYYLYVDNTKNTSSTSNATGWASFSYSGWSQHNLSIQPDTSYPTLVSNTETLSTTSVRQGYPTVLTGNFTDDNAVASAKARVRSSDGTEANWTMTCTSGANVSCTADITSQVVGTATVTRYYPKDTFNNEANITSPSQLTFQVTSSPGGGAGSGGGGGGAWAIPTPTVAERLSGIYVATIRLDEKDISIKIPSDKAKGIAVFALNLYFETPYQGEYTFTIKTFESYNSPFQNAYRHVEISPELSLRPPASIDFMVDKSYSKKYKTLEFYDLRNTTTPLESSLLSQEGSSEIYRVKILKLGKFAIVGGSKQTSAGMTQGGLMSIDALKIILLLGLIGLLIFLVLRGKKPKYAFMVGRPAKKR